MGTDLFLSDYFPEREQHFCCLPLHILLISSCDILSDLCYRNRVSHWKDTKVRCRNQQAFLKSEKNMKTTYSVWAHQWFWDERVGAWIKLSLQEWTCPKPTWQHTCSYFFHRWLFQRWGAEDLAAHVGPGVLQFLSPPLPSHFLYIEYQHAIPTRIKRKKHVSLRPPKFLVFMECREFSSPSN